MTTRFHLRILYFLILTPLAVCVILAGCSELSKPSRKKLYHMGERVEAGPLVYTILEAEWQSQIGEGADARVPRDQFLLLRMSVTNSAIREASVPRLRLIGAGGAIYDEVTDGDRVPGWLGMLRPLKPTDTIEGWILFDAPRADCKLEVADDAFDPEQKVVALVEVRLRFASGSADLPQRKR